MSEEIIDLGMIMGKEQYEGLTKQYKKDMKKAIKKKENTEQAQQIDDIYQRLNELTTLIQSQMAQESKPKNANSLFKMSSDNIQSHGDNLTILKNPHENTQQIQQIQQVQQPIIAPIQIPTPQIIAQPQPVVQQIPQQILPNPPKPKRFKRRFIFFGKSREIENLPIKQDIRYAEKNEVVMQSMLIADLKRCELCNSKIQKSKIYKEENEIVQFIKCKSVICPFYKKIVIKK